MLTVVIGEVTIIIITVVINRGGERGTSDSFPRKGRPLLHERDPIPPGRQEEPASRTPGKPAPRRRDEGQGGEDPVGGVQC